MKQVLLWIVMVSVGTPLALAEPGAAVVCQQLSPFRQCEEGGAFLCVNAPPGGVDGDFVLLQGRLNLENSKLGQFSVSVQHEYTKELKNLVLAAPLREDCRGQPLSPSQNFCLEANGNYAVYVPLEELGPYTISVTASRFQGRSMQKRVRSARVIAPSITEEVVRFEPGIGSGLVPEGTRSVKVILDLLAGCGESKDNCDFIGASTGGVVVTADNEMETARKSVQCETNTIQGGAGRFVLGIPVQPGQNRITVTICNAATGFDENRCPTVGPESFSVGGAETDIEILEPSPKDRYLFDSTRHAGLSLQFRIRGYKPKICDDTVRFSLNVSEEKSLCPNRLGLFETRLRPKEGYNVISIKAHLPHQTLSETLTFGWGHPLTPFDASGKVKPEEAWRLPQALRLWLSKHFIQETVLQEWNDFMASDDFESWLAEVTEAMGEGQIVVEEEPDAALQKEIKEALGYCPAGEGISGMRLRFSQPPRIGEAVIRDLRWEPDRLEAVIEAKEVDLRVQLVNDADGDGTPDLEPLPLKIGFQTVTLHPILEPMTLHGKKSWKLSSSHTDCSYKREGACLKMPALLTPKLYKGNANKAGYFVICDPSPGISEKMKKVCKAFNNVDRQTRGALQEKILDAINNIYGCGGTVALKMAMEKGVPFDFEEDGLSITGNIGLEELKIEERGMAVSLNTYFGKRETLEKWPKDIRQRQPGILTSLRKAGLHHLVSHEDGISVDMALPILSQLFWGLKGEEGNDFSVTIDEVFFKEQDFDFEEKCNADEGEEADPLCKIRPRAQEIFGSIITEYGYMEPTEPVRLTLTPSKVFPLRVTPLNAEGKVRLEWADWDLALASDRETLIVAKWTLLLTVTVSPAVLNAQDPDHYVITVKPVANESRLWLTPKPDHNFTIIPGTALLSDLKQKVEAFLFSVGREFKIPIPRFYTFPEESLFTKMGLQELTWGHKGFELTWQESNNRLQVKWVPIVD